MKIRISMLTGLCVVSLAGIAAPMAVSAATGIYLNIGPPEARYEAVPPPRRGYLWAPGYWDTKRGKHSWAAGHWERERTGYHFTQPNWSQHDSRWELQRGRWDKGDGNDDREHRRSDGR